MGYIGEKQQVVSKVFEDLDETEAPQPSPEEQVIQAPAPALAASQA